MDGHAPEEIAQRILAARKYRTLDPAFVGRVAALAAGRFADPKAALKYAKRRLHQAVGAFATAGPAAAVDAAIDEILAGRTDARTALSAAMRAHASTAERLAWLEPFYRQMSDWCGPAGSVVDLGCGLNPLAIPWMSLAPEADYWCCEVDTGLVAALARLGEILPVRVHSVSCDLVAAPPRVKAEVALMLKLVNTLDQQDSGAAARLLLTIDCPQVLLSLPRRSLSGRRHYRVDTGELLARIIDGTGYVPADQRLFGDELLCHLTRTGATRAAI
jgi:16S rRNA (guanine(1405)-N(7))-methyltransferase